MFNYESEERCGYLVDKSYKYIWGIEMEILKEIIRICDKYNISYFVFAGTLLGAIRHEGFIPWDDDMDIAMRRIDYERFIEVAEKELDFSKYCLQKGEEFGEIYEGFARIRYNNSTAIIKRDRNKKCNHGVFIDIYPLDNVPEQKWKQKIQFSLIKNLSGMIFYYIYDDEGQRHKAVKRGVKMFKNQNFWKWLAKFVKSVCQMYNNTDTAMIGTLSCDPYDRNYYWYLEDVRETIEVPYEDMQVKVPIGYDRCLKLCYGNYMEFPPVEERGQWHQNIYYDPFVPFTEYKDKTHLFD